MIDSTEAMMIDADRTARPLVEVEHLSIRFPIGRTGFWGGQVRYVHAVDDVSVTIGKGETLGLVGESGSGKTTVRACAPAPDRRRQKARSASTVTTSPTSRGEELRELRRHMQLVFQDPYASLNPRMTVLELVAEPLVVHGLAKNTRRGAAAGRRPARSVRPARRRRRSLPARLQRRPAPAHRHRPRARAAARRSSSPTSRSRRSTCRCEPRSSTSSRTCSTSSA